jgi:hypothetical protein
MCTKYQSLTCCSTEIRVDIGEVILIDVIVPMPGHSIIIVDLFTDSLAFSQSSGHVFLLLFIVMSEKLLPVGRVCMLRLLLKYLCLWLLFLSINVLHANESATMYNVKFPYSAMNTDFRFRKKNIRFTTGNLHRVTVKM